MSELETMDVEAAQAKLDEALLEGLAKFGHSEFRPGQLEAMKTLLMERSLLLVAPTGGGKSLTYQLPATILRGTTLVVSPLIALMHDQVQSLEDKGIRATFLASTLDGEEMRRRMSNMGEGAYDLVYVAPERLFFPGFRDLLLRVQPPLVAIDEAHCISEWGHDFRPEYSRIGEVLRDLPRTRVLACTATATPVVRDDILARLGLSQDTPQLLKGFARPNLELRAREHAGKKDIEVQVDAALREALGDADDAQGSAIIYSPTRKKTEAMADRLASLGWRAEAYHAGLSPQRREGVSRDFANDDVDIVVATNAFGMGIDRSDVRAVIHLAPPGSIEAYYQEVGRAGRDGERAYGTMLFGGQDLPLRRRLLESGEHVDPEAVEHKWSLFLELMRWAEGGSCRHDAILRYFGDEAETLAGCGLCDVCCSLDQDEGHDAEEVSLIVRKALSGVARTHGRFGVGATVRLLRGEEDERLSRAGLDQVRTFGVLSEHPGPWLQRLVRRLVSAGWVTFTGDQHPMVKLTPQGKAVMSGEREVRLLLPSTQSAKKSGKGRGRRATQDPAMLDPLAAELFEKLRAHRLEVAKSETVAPYMVASDRSLRDIAMLRPGDAHQLQMAHGIGPSKVERFGEGLLSVVAAFEAAHQ